MPSMGASPTSPRVFTVGALANLDPAKIILLVNSALGVTGGRYDSLRVPGASTGYVVSSGKTLYIVKFEFVSQRASANSQNITLGYADTSVDNSVAAPTNPVSLMQSTYIIGTANPDGATDGHRGLDGLYPIPAGKIPYSLNSASPYNLTAWGIEL